MSELIKACSLYMHEKLRCDDYHVFFFQSIEKKTKQTYIYGIQKARACVVSRELISHLDEINSNANATLSPKAI